MDLPLCSRKQMPGYGMETSEIASVKEVQNSIISSKIDVHTFLGCTGTNFGTLPRVGHNSKQCLL
jgi:hypothetical protein